MNVVLISTYELGRQPFGLASPAAWLSHAGAHVTCLDLSRQALAEEPIRQADFIAFYVPMHTATRLAVEVLPKVRALNPHAHLCFYGLYAPVNESFLRRLGAGTILGGEFEQALVNAVARVTKSRASGVALPPGPQPEPVISLDRLDFLLPQRQGLPPLERYAHLNHPASEPRIVGYTEASRGCKHLCRHCPIVPVYGGRFRVVGSEIVLEDIRRQVEAGAWHITFGDPDFFNGPRHSLGLVTRLHTEFPQITYDVTIKVEHLLRHAAHLTTLRDTGCLFVTTAAEALDDAILGRLDKGHTVADFIAVVELFREVGLTLAPTFVAFTPWTTLGGYCNLLRRIAELDLVENVAPVQLAIRLLIPAGSRLLDLPEIAELAEGFDEASLVYPWSHADPRVDQLCCQAQAVIQRGQKRDETRSEIFARVRRLAAEAAGLPPREIPKEEVGVDRAAVPYLTEPWYC